MNKKLGAFREATKKQKLQVTLNDTVLLLFCFLELVVYAIIQLINWLVHYYYFSYVNVTQKNHLSNPCLLSKLVYYLK